MRHLIVIAFVAIGFEGSSQKNYYKESISKTTNAFIPFKCIGIDSLRNRTFFIWGFDLQIYFKKGLKLTDSLTKVNMDRVINEAVLDSSSFTSLNNQTKLYEANFNKEVFGKRVEGKRKFYEYYFDSLGALKRLYTNQFSYIF